MPKEITLDDQYQRRDSNQIDMLAEMLHLVPFAYKQTHYTKAMIENLFGCYVQHDEVIEIFNLAGFKITSKNRSNYMINMSETEASFLAIRGQFTCKQHFPVWRRIRATKQRAKMLTHFDKWHHSFMEYSIQVDDMFLGWNKEARKALKDYFEQDQEQQEQIVWEQLNEESQQSAGSEV